MGRTVGPPQLCPQWARVTEPGQHNWLPLSGDTWAGVILPLDLAHMAATQYSKSSNLPKPCTLCAQRQDFGPFVPWDVADFVGLRGQEGVMGPQGAGQ